MFEGYYSILNEIDTLCSRLHLLHAPHTQCRKGCSSCCSSFRVLPLEFHAIFDELQKSTVAVNSAAGSEDCIFLQEGSCTIYENRPVICRSHGLPILETGDEEEEATLSFCQLNFAKVDDAYFLYETSYPQTDFNQKLYSANLNFIKNFSGKTYAPDTLIPLNDLLSWLHISG